MLHRTAPDLKNLLLFVCTVNLGVTFLGFTIFVAGCIAWGISTEHFVPMAKALVFDGFMLMVLAMLINTGIKKNNMDMVAYANATLFFFAFLTVSSVKTSKMAEQIVVLSLC